MAIRIFSILYTENNYAFLVKVASKHVPEWMKYSTVHPSGDMAPDLSSNTVQPMQQAMTDNVLPGERSVESLLTYVHCVHVYMYSMDQIQGIIVSHFERLYASFKTRRVRV